MKRALLMVGLLAVGWTSAGAQSWGQIRFVVEDTYIWKDRSTKSDAVDGASPGEKIRVDYCSLGEGGEWCAVFYPNATSRSIKDARGFLPSRLLTTTAPKQEASSTNCCRVCRKGKPCGNSCIAANKTCRKGPGCACAG